MGGAGDLVVRRRGEICVGKHEGKRALGRCRHGWEDEFKMDLEKWNGGMYWAYMARDRDKCWAM